MSADIAQAVEDAKTEFGRAVRGMIREHVDTLTTRLDPARGSAFKLDGEVRDRAQSVGYLMGSTAAKIATIMFSEVDAIRRQSDMHRASSERLLAEYLDRALKAERELDTLKQK